MPSEIESVSLYDYASPEDAAAVEAAFARAGLVVEARPILKLEVPEGWGAASLPWHVYVVLGVPLGMFLSGFLGAAGEDAWSAVKQWVLDLFAAHDQPRYTGGSLDLRDPAGTRIAFSPPLPHEALDALAEIDWNSLKGGDLHWDEERHEWRDHRR